MKKIYIAIVLLIAMGSVKLGILLGEKTNIVPFVIPDKNIKLETNNRFTFGNGEFWDIKKDGLPTPFNKHKKEFSDRSERFYNLMFQRKKSEIGGKL